MENDDFKNLSELLKLFKDRPYHLAKYLLNNSALTDEFIQKISIDKLSKDIEKDSNDIKPLFFNDINQMTEHFNSFLSDIHLLDKNKTKNELMIELNNKLNESINNEMFEDAARIRDYMMRNNIKRLK